MYYSNQYINDLAGVLAGGYYSYDPLSFLRISGQAEFVEIVKFGALAGIGMVLIEVLVLNLLVYRKLFLSKSVGGDVVRVLVTAPIIEECVFRLGGIASVYYFTGSLLAALVVTSVAFGVVHSYMGPHAVVSATLAGMILGLVFLSGGLVAAIAAHMTVNLVSVLFRI